MSEEKERKDVIVYNDPKPAGKIWYRKCRVLGIEPESNMTLGRAKTLVAEAIGGDASNSSCYKANQRPIYDWQIEVMNLLGENVDLDATTEQDFNDAMKKRGFQVWQRMYMTMKHTYYWTMVQLDPYADAVPAKEEDKAKLKASASETFTNIVLEGNW